MSEWWRLFIELGVCLVSETSWCLSAGAMVYGRSRQVVVGVYYMVEVVLGIHWWSESQC